MSESSQHRAPKGCYLVIGHDQFDHTDYQVGRYISLSRARKAARNKARTANGDPTSFSDIFFVYDSAGGCLYRVTYDDLPAHLRQPSARVNMPEALPPSPKTYDRLFIKILLGLLLIPTIWLGKNYYDDLEVTDQTGYAELRKRFVMERPKDYPSSCDAMTWDHYQVVLHNYEAKLKPRPPRPKAVYLRDKLRYYDEMDFEGPGEYGLLKAYVRQELAQAQSGETLAPDDLHERNRQRYLSIMEKTLLLREELGSFVAGWDRNSAYPVTNWDYRQLKRALAACEQIVNEGWIPSLAFLLNNGGGPEVPLDGYEAGAFTRMIAEARARQDVQKANTLYQALISYQVMNWAVYFDGVRDSITRYSQFLDEQGLDKPAQARALESRLAAVNPYEYSREYQEYRERTLRFMKASLTGPIRGH